MSSIGEKIKEVFTGHSHHDTHNASNVKTPDVDAPGAYPTDKTAHKDEVLSRPNRANSAHKHTDSGIDIERPRHDPEVDAKQATSAAGNYPVSIIYYSMAHMGGRHVSLAPSVGT